MIVVTLGDNPELRTALAIAGYLPMLWSHLEFSNRKCRLVRASGEGTWFEVSIMQSCLTKVLKERYPEVFL